MSPSPLSASEGGRQTQMLTPQLSQWLLSASMLAALAAATGCSLYLLGRFVALHIPGARLVFNGWALFFALPLLPLAVESGRGFLTAALFLGLCALGAWIHLKTGATTNRVDAFLFVMAIMQANALCGALISQVTSLSETQIYIYVYGHYIYVQAIYQIALLVAPIFPIIVVRMIQNLRLRPGLDRHLTPADIL